MVLKGEQTWPAVDPVGPPLSNERAVCRMLRAMREEIDALLAKFEGKGEARQEADSVESDDLDCTPPWRNLMTTDDGSDEDGRIGAEARV